MPTLYCKGTFRKPLIAHRNFLSDFVVVRALAPACRGAGQALSRAPSELLRSDQLYRKTSRHGPLSHAETGYFHQKLGNPENAGLSSWLPFETTPNRFHEKNSYC